MKRASIVLTLVAVICIIGGYEIKVAVQPPNTADLEGMVKALIEAVETAKVEESTSDEALHKAIDKEVNLNVSNPRKAEGSRRDGL